MGRENILPIARFSQPGQLRLGKNLFGRRQPFGAVMLWCSDLTRLPVGLISFLVNQPTLTIKCPSEQLITLPRGSLLMLWLVRQPASLKVPRIFLKLRLTTRPRLETGYRSFPNTMRNRPVLQVCAYLNRVH